MENEKFNQYLKDKKTSFNTKATKTKIKQTFVKLEDGCLVEQVVNPEPCFLIFNPSDGDIQKREAVKIGDKFIYPLDGDLVSKKVIRFPQSADDYENTESLRLEIKKFIHKYVDIHIFYEELSSYFILLTWLFDRLTTITYLGIFGDYGTGKTRAVQTIGTLCYKPVCVSGSLTCAPIYRILEQSRGTLIINEFDFEKSDMGMELIKILNNGFEKGMSVLRVKDKTREVEAFDAFGPKIFAYRKKKKDQAFESRLITIPMEETRREDISVILPTDFELDANRIRNKLLMFRFRNYPKQPEVDQSIFQGIERRLRQTLYPLLTVIDDPDFLKQLRKFIQDYQQQTQADRGLSWIADNLRVLVDLTCQLKEITVGDFTNKINEEKDKDKKITSRAIGSFVRNELKLKTQRITSGDKKGQYEIKIEPEKLKSFCLRYGVDIPEGSSLHSLSSPYSYEESEGGEVSEGFGSNENKVKNMKLPEIQQIFTNEKS